MSRADRFALLLSLFAVLVSALVTDRIFERLPHIEDEMAYVWQADAVAGGRLTVPSPVAPKSFLVPFVVDYHGQRFGKYPPGWPALLGIGVLFGARSWVNPLLAGLAVWLAYRLGKRVSTETVGLLTAGLTLTSPFFLINSGSLLSHPFGLVLSEAFALAWLDAWDDEPRLNPWWPTMAAALSLGMLALTRPLTAVAVAFPFAVHGLYLLVRGDRQTRRRLVVFGMTTLGVACLMFVWQFAVTGDPRINPYTLWWPYDKIGFGPGVGRLESGHTLYQAWINTKFSLHVGAHDLFGWGKFSWIFLPFGVAAAIRYRMGKALLLGSVILSLVVFYLAYWIGSSLFGPRYYYEGLFSLTLLSALGIAWLAGWPVRQGDSWRRFDGWQKARPLAITALVVFLLSVNLLQYTPKRLAAMHGLYGVYRARLEPFLRPEAQAMTPALVVVHPGDWVEYGTLLELQDPWLKTPFIFIISRSPDIDAGVAAQFPDRNVIYYYPSEPGAFYRKPRSSQ
jgi:hypothetical protein